MVHRGVRSREATHVTKRKYRSRQTITSKLSVAIRSVVNRKKQRLVKVLPALRQVQSCIDKYGDSSRKYANAITNLEALHASAAAKAASEIIDEIGLHTEQCKPAAAWRAINRLTGRKFKPFNCLSAASIADSK